VIASAVPIQLLGDAGVLPLHASGGATPGHPFFGAAFLFIGAILVVETLAGPIWSRDRWRRMAWPASLAIAGLGMLAVSYVQPTEKPLHLTLAVLLLLGGLFEARYRLGQIPRSLADTFAIPALVLGGLVIGPMHNNGSNVGDPAALAHLMTGVAGFALAGIRLSQVRFGPTAILDATFGIGVMALGMSLLMVQQFHAAH